MSSVIEICNKALAYLSHEPIITLDDTSRAGRLCSQMYSSTCRGLLRSFPWSFASKRVSLALRAAKPAFGFEYSFTLPPDYVRLLLTNPSGITYAIEGRYILANVSTLAILYTAMVDDPNDMDALFIETLELRLAMTMCLPLTQNGQLLQLLQAIYGSKISEARMAQSQESEAQEVAEGGWLEARV